MTARFIVRLLDADGQLLSWADVLAEARPQGRPRSTPFFSLNPTRFVIERDGVASRITIHWADVDVARVGPDMTPTPVQAGQVFTFTWLGPVWLIEGSQQDVPLPAVTVRAPVAIGVPAGGMGVVS
jgi:hypothetical protein